MKTKLTDADKIARLKAILRLRCCEKEQRDTLAILERAEGKWSPDTIENALDAYESSFGYTREDPIT